jgi:hypothetical protein
MTPSRMSCTVPLASSRRVSRIGGDAATAFDPGGAGHDRADDRAQAPGVMRVEERRAAVQAVEAHGVGADDQFLVEFAIHPVATAHRGAGRPDDVDRVCTIVERTGAHLGVAHELRQTDDLGHWLVAILWWLLGVLLRPGIGAPVAAIIAPPRAGRRPSMSSASLASSTTSKNVLVSAMTLLPVAAPGRDELLRRHAAGADGGDVGVEVLLRIDRLDGRHVDVAGIAVASGRQLAGEDGAIGEPRIVGIDQPRRQDQPLDLFDQAAEFDLAGAQLE